MLITVLVFVGLEKRSVYSYGAKEHKPVDTATVFGFIGVLCLLMLVTMLYNRLILRPELTELRQSSMAAVLETIIESLGCFVSRSSLCL